MITLICDKNSIYLHHIQGVTFFYFSNILGQWLPAVGRFYHPFHLGWALQRGQPLTPLISVYLSICKS